ncbi:ALDH-like protein [Macrolepiota fuliginosa MF-IS2]|uniref:ALDH-like protein n=1 Tax=Macrolepiota fuliginosa MF-IS2 TaxID=1400762 RepID=A0A9P6BYK2_9AGAR|nr:ALDH-like protein [Macrolepiota fuliginosa MF-IS2]
MAPIPFTPLIIDGQERPSNAIDAASKALKSWEASRLVDRRDIFLKASDLFAGEYYSSLLIQCNQQIAFAPRWDGLDGKILSDYLLSTAGLVDYLRGEYFPSATVPGAQVYTQRRAKGALFAIVPWNAPGILTVRALAFPIFCGNTIVLKGSELTPMVHYVITKVFHEAGLPNGVLNCISASLVDTPSLVSEIIAHPQIRHVNFTGSDRVGKIIAVEAAKHPKPCVLELGGKAPAIVLKDADLKEAARAIAFGATANSGQVCMSTERVIVHKDVAESLSSSVRNIISGLKAGDTTVDASAKLGPLFSERSAERLVDILKKTKNAGAHVLLGDLSRDKAVIQPHLLTGVKPGMALWDKESFGPVIVFATFETVEEAIGLANASTYSLTSSVWAVDLAMAQEIAFQLRYGTVNINGVTIHAEPTDGLIGLSGSSGYGRFDIEHFTDKRTTIIHPKGRQYPLL